MLKEQFLNKIKLKHPNNLIKYDYSLLPNEFKAHSKIPIICKEHGVFEQNNSNHLFGSGCPKCKVVKLSIRRISNKIEFVKKAREVHNDKYNYDKVNYINSHAKVIITCPIHGDFEQTPSSHLSGSDCLKCGIVKISISLFSNKEQFIRKAKIIHGDKYSYDKVDYKHSHKKVIITCQFHGDFEQRPTNHLSGHGCFACYGTYKRNKTKLTDKIKNL